ncbi:taste receptor type 2 member 143-like [Tenrec ecaudatus]|uniref:taste receptor type 2 member 143-like n=1 Tax=Tenrec ecaudatus TaxID=94439 RepID=UPI003F594A49
MPFTPMPFFIVGFFLVSLAAILQNGFMVATLAWGWMWGRTLTSGDLIVACLAASRLSLHSVTILNNILVITNSCCQLGYLHIIWDFTNILAFWVNAWLSAFYCMKIASFSHPTFLWLRWRLSHSVPKLLLTSLAISVVTTIPSVIRNVTVVLKDPSRPLYSNGSWAGWVKTFHQHYLLLQVTLVLSLPFLLFLVSISLLLFSLHRHHSQMQARHHRPRDSSTQAHTVALRSLTCSLVFYTSYFLSLAVIMMKVTPQNRHIYWVSQVVIYTGISLHSTILLISSPRFRGALRNGVQGCRARGCGSSDHGQVPPEGSAQGPVVVGVVSCETRRLPC